MPLQLSLFVKGVNLPQFAFEKLPANQVTGEMQRRGTHTLALCLLTFFSSSGSGGIG